jgi:hypothetical protein
MVSKVYWSSKTISSKPSIGNIEVGIGNTISEAMAAILSNKVTGNQLSMPNKFLAAMQYKSIADNGIAENGLSELQKRMHVKGFNTVSGGSTWVIEQQQKQVTPTEQDANLNNNQAFDTSISDMLFQLNELQQQYEQTISLLKCKQAEFYAAKFKLSLLSTDAVDISTITNQPENFVNQQTDTIINLKKEIEILSTQSITLYSEETSAKEKEKKDWPADYTGSIAKQYNDLVLDLKRNAAMKDFDLKQVALPQYYKPTDPAIAINGLFNTQNIGSATDRYLDKTQVSCRLVSDLVHSIEWPYMSKVFIYKAIDLVKDTTVWQALNNVPSNIALLFAESILLNPQNAA